MWGPGWAVLDEGDGHDGHDGKVGAMTVGFDYPSVNDQVRKKYVWDSRAPGVSWDKDRGEIVYGTSELAAAVDVEGGVHDGHGHSLQQGDGGVSQHGKTRGKTGEHGQGQHEVVEEIDDDDIMSEQN